MAANTRIELASSGEIQKDWSASGRRRSDNMLTRNAKSKQTDKEMTPPLEQAQSKTDDSSTMFTSLLLRMEEQRRQDEQRRDEQRTWHERSEWPK